MSTSKKLLRLNFAMLGVSALFALWTLHKVNGNNNEDAEMQVFFAAFLMMPYGVLAVLIFSLHKIPRISRAVARAALVPSAILLFLTVMVYGSMNSSSTGSLALVFLPLWLTLGGPLIFAVCLAVCLAIDRWKNANQDGLPRCETCGYVLLGLDTPRCPECGSQFDPLSIGDNMHEKIEEEAADAP